VSTGVDIDGNKIKDGEYVYGPDGVRGVYAGGMIQLDFDENSD
jgi:hypothetical protein